MKLSRWVPHLVYLVTVAVLAAAYLIAAKLGLKLAFVHASATAVWPPTGIAMAAFLVFGYRMWPAVAIGAFLVNLTTAGSALSSLGIAAGNTIEGLVAAWLVERFANGRHAFERPQDVLKFAFLAALASPTLSATIGVTSLALTSFASWADFAPIWLTWWLGDAAGALIVAPVLVLWTVDVDRPWSEAHRIELATLLLALIASG